MTPYTLEDFDAAITRELQKRKVTYPKILEKKHKQWQGSAEELQREAKSLALEQTMQMELLLMTQYILQEVSIDPWYNECFRELQRELRLRKSLYPRWVRFGLITQETSQREMSVWTALTNYFDEKYCHELPWRKPSTRKKY